MERLLIVITMGDASRSASGRTVDIETARTERSVPIEETFREKWRSSLLRAIVVIAITSEKIVVMIVSIFVTTAIPIVSEIDGGRCRYGASRVIMVTVFTVGFRAVPVARGHARGVVVYLVSY